jgi:hypothetical protein
MQINGLPDASKRCKSFNQLVCRKIMNARNEIRRPYEHFSEQLNPRLNLKIRIFNYYIYKLLKNVHIICI